MFVCFETPFISKDYSKKNCMLLFLKILERNTNKLAPIFNNYFHIVAI